MQSKKIFKTLKLVESKYVLFAANDDFYGTDASEGSVALDFEIVDGAEGRFVIDGSTGQLSVASSSDVDLSGILVVQSGIHVEEVETQGPPYDTPNCFMANKLDSQRYGGGRDLSSN